MALVRGRPPLAVRAEGVDMPSGGRRVGASAAEVRQMSLMYATCAVHEYVKLLPCGQVRAHHPQPPHSSPGVPPGGGRSLPPMVCCLISRLALAHAHTQRWCAHCCCRGFDKDTRMRCCAEVKIIATWNAAPYIRRASQINAPHSNVHAALGVLRLHARLQEGVKPLGNPLRVGLSPMNTRSGGWTPPRCRCRAGCTRGRW